MNTTTGKVIDRAISALLAIWLAGWILRTRISRGVTGSRSSEFGLSKLMTVT